MGSTALVVWPLRCSRCRQAWTYPRARSLDSAYLQAHIDGWAVTLHPGDEPADLECPNCVRRSPQRTEI